MNSRVDFESPIGNLLAAEMGSILCSGNFIYVIKIKLIFFYDFNIKIMTKTNTLVGIMYDFESNLWVIVIFDCDKTNNMIIQIVLHCCKII